MSRGNLFAKLERAERVVEHALEPPPRPRIVPPSPPARSAPPLPEPAAIRTARMRRPQPKVTIAMQPRPPLPGHAATLSARSLKCSLVFAPEQVAAIPPPQGKSVPLVIAVGGRQIQASLNAKSLRKAIAIIATHGAGNTLVIVQGKLEAGDILAEAGMSVTIKKAVPAADE